MKNILLIFFFLLLWCLPAYSQIYRYYDEKGNAFYVDSLDKIPAPFREEVLNKAVVLEENIISEHMVKSTGLPFKAGSLKPNVLRLGDRVAPGVRAIRINVPIELDFRTRAEIFAIRGKYVEEHEDLLRREYQPYFGVFGGIISHKPWLGIQGKYCHGGQRNLAEGMSEESRFIANPFLLLALDEGRFFVQSGGVCNSLYPRPVNLSWDAHQARAVVTYDMTRFFNERAFIESTPQEEVVLGFVTYNARDFGFNYLTAFFEESVGIKPAQGSRLFDRPNRIRSHLHEQTEGFPEGQSFNNRTANDTQLTFSINQIPGQLHCKLWKKGPRSLDERPDFVFIMKFE